MQINNLSRFRIIDKKTGQEIIIPRGFILDYANDYENCYSLAARGGYKVVLAQIEIIRK